jgi:hypothetical protein
VSESKRRRSVCMRCVGCAGDYARAGRARLAGVAVPARVRPRHVRPRKCAQGYVAARADNKQLSRAPAVLERAARGGGRARRGDGRRATPPRRAAKNLQRRVRARCAARVASDGCRPLWASRRDAHGGQLGNFGTTLAEGEGRQNALEGHSAWRTQDEVDARLPSSCRSRRTRFLNR